MKDSELLFYNKPSRRWTDALPLGNGSLGAMVYGTTLEERLSMNLDTLWSGKPNYKENPDAYEYFVKARELSLNGDNAAAQEILEEHCLGYDSHIYLPLCDVIVAYKEGGCETKNYKRTLDLTTAISNVSYSTGKYDLTEEWFISKKRNALIGKITSTKKFSFNVYMNCQLRHTSYTENDVILLDGQCPGEMEDCRQKFSDENGGMFFRTGLKIKTDGDAFYNGSAIYADNVTEAYICFAAEDSFNGFDKCPVTEGKEYKNAVLERIADVFNSDYEELKAEHIADYSELYGRVNIDIGSADLSDVPTNERLNRFADDKSDLGLYTLLFNYGRYLAISGSRPGSQPMNLQGIWNNRLIPPWGSNYTVNINTEMNYWPILMCNLAELNEPLVRMMQELSVAGKRVAKEYYNADGFTAHHNVDIWRMSAPALGNTCWAFWYNGAGWMSRHLFEQYEYTLDKDFLREKAYPVLKGCAEFYLSMLVPDKDGYLICAPSTSPENHYLMPNGDELNVSQTTFMTMAICRDVFLNTVSSCEILGCDSDFAHKLKEAYEKLLPFKIGDFGRLQEWYEDRPDEEPHHRHVSHLYALHPANLISPNETPELADACRKTLELRGDDGTGWSLGWKINFFARLLDGNHALKLLDTQLRFVDEENTNYTNGGGTYANLFDAHPPFQIDGNFGAVSGITEMLLQSVDKKIRLLPALPDRWSSGKVEGLCAKGGVTVSIEWSDGKLKKVVLCGINANVTVAYNGIDKNVTVNGALELDGNLDIL